LFKFKLREETPVGPVGRVNFVVATTTPTISRILVQSKHSTATGTHHRTPIGISSFRARTRTEITSSLFCIFNISNTVALGIMTLIISVLIYHGIGVYGYFAEPPYHYIQ